MSSVVFLFVLMGLLGGPTMAKVYKVGDDAGWTSGVNYEAWASQQSFQQGDTIRFQFNQHHDVELLMSEAEFEQCESRSPTPVTFASDEPVVLDNVGFYYFICGYPKMCQSGMKLKIMVLPPSAPFFPQLGPPFSIVYPSPAMPCPPSHAAPSTLSLHTTLIALLIFTSCSLFLLY